MIPTFKGGGKVLPLYFLYLLKSTVVGMENSQLIGRIPFLDPHQATLGRAKKLGSCCPRTGTICVRVKDAHDAYIKEVGFQSHGYGCPFDSLDPLCRHPWPSGKPSALRETPELKEYSGRWRNILHHAKITANILFRCFVIKKIIWYSDSTKVVRSCLLTPWIQIGKI